MADEEKPQYGIWARIGAVILTVVFVMVAPLLGAAAVIGFIRAVEIIWELFH